MDPHALSSFLEKHPSIKYYFPSSPDFDAVAAAYIIVPHKPPAIVRPQSAADVSALITHCVATDTPFTVSSGNHELDGRSQVEGALRIDMRDVAYVEVGDDRKTARIGGGVLGGALLDKLAGEGVMTPTATFPGVSFTGWAIQGGYGCVSPSFGLGIDQIVGARVVNYRGECVEADEELLEALRGGGGNFGVVVELTIKVYPLQEVQAGIIMFKPEDIGAGVRAFFEKWNDVVASNMPDKLFLAPGLLPAPDIGTVIGMGFTWLGPLDDEAAQWRDRVAAMSAPIVANTIHTTTTGAYVAELGSLMSPTTYRGKVQAAYVRGLQLSDGAIDVVAKYGSAMPPSATIAAFHILRGYSTRNTSTPSLFRYRESHMMMEIVGLSSSEEEAGECESWADAFGREMRAAEGMLEGSYLPFMAQDTVDLEKVYGEKYGRLLELKRKFDPNNVFRNAIPRLEI